MDYKDALQYLDSFINYEKVPFFDYKESLKLERMRYLAGMLGNPQDGLRCIHITGTKGKGSTSAMVASILKEAGFRVGLYTSPHLVSFRERIRVGDELIGEEELSSLVEHIKAATNTVDKNSDEFPTFFEVYTAIAFLYFAQKKTDFCVLEVGMGGRLDATNIIEKPLCCGITQISYEHTHKLGSTLSEIAREKAGIIKKGALTVSSEQAPEAAERIRTACREKNSRLFEVGADINFKKEDKQIFSMKGIFGDYPFMETGLMGDHQFMNAATAVGLVESLRFHDIIITPDAIRTGLKNVSWPGRLQVLKRSPYLVLDGAQNRASANALAKAVKEYFEYDKLILVLGISRDKDIKGICEELGAVADRIILTRANLPRAEEPGVLKKFFSEAAITGSVRQAVDLAERVAGPQDLILATGSFFVLGEVLNES
jgi:dihydrofolate synthase/folylpolyglutamate synthase